VFTNTRDYVIIITSINTSTVVLISTVNAYAKRVANTRYCIVTLSSIYAGLVLIRMAVASVKADSCSLENLANASDYIVTVTRSNSAFLVVNPITKNIIT
jgi:hypothetical protein